MHLCLEMPNVHTIYMEMGSHYVLHEGSSNSVTWHMHNVAVAISTALLHLFLYNNACMNYLA